MYCLSCLPLSAQQAAPVGVTDADVSQPVLPFASPPVLPAAKAADAGYPGFQGVPVLNTKGKTKGGVTRIVSPGLGQGPPGMVVSSRVIGANLDAAPAVIGARATSSSLRAKASFGKPPPQTMVLDVEPEQSPRPKGGGK